MVMYLNRNAVMVQTLDSGEPYRRQLGKSVKTRASLTVEKIWVFIIYIAGMRMSGFGLLWIGRALVLLQLFNGVLGWGKEGHYAICKMAEGYLTEDALAAVKELLPDYAEGDLANVCSWPDEIRNNFHWRWTSPLHYVDTPDFKCNYEYCRDCHDSGGHKDRCVTGAINNYTMQLKSFYQDSVSEAKYNLTEALLFLSHFIGDVHQPLHVGFTGDEGGNTITVRWFRRKTNLHHVWDNMIIESALKTFYGSDIAVMIKAIQRNFTVCFSFFLLYGDRDTTITHIRETLPTKKKHQPDGWSNDKSSWESCKYNQTVCPDPYASESISLACKFAYRNATPGTTLGDDYFLSRLPIVEKRLAQGGIRLAATLNRIFTPQIKIADA
ncbi:hypothetical protein Patl1_10855 [Pistacia atlantica]|uniref:Uncharacterized protein n=1 Tax=Pistacia atlantica TaxID=434234 RepID=A0ACC1A5R1_9ROSI|nr:hypothetical protein Patl1_10855 [Pistacia atlantica]